MIANYLLKLCDKTFVKGVPKYWRRGLIVLLYKGDDVGNYRNYRRISLLSFVVGKIYPGIWLKDLCLMTEELIVKDQTAFKNVEECVNQIFTMQQIRERENVNKLYFGLMIFQQAYDRVRETVIGVSRIWSSE